MWSRTRCADAGQQMHDAEACDTVARILDEAQQCQDVLHMRGVEKFQPAKLHKRNVALGELDLQRSAVRRRAEEHGLLFEEWAFLAVFEDALDDVARLVGLVADRHKAGFCRRTALRPEVLGEPFPCQVDDAVGGGEDGLGRAVIAFERDDLGLRAELLGEIEDVAHGGSAKRIDGLRVVADHRQTAASWLQRQQNRRLQSVGVLIFIDEHVIEASADLVGDRGVGHHLRPVEQEVVVIEDVLLLFGLDVSGE
jgi:hypothetical protein